jgi:hypothetical protein
MGESAMAIACKSERSLLGYDEFEVVRTTHHPAIYDLDAETLRAAAGRVRAMRDKERTLARQRRRELRGKSERRGQSFPGSVDRPLLRKQVFSAALKRLNREISRQAKLDARSAHVEAARRALELRRAAAFVHRPATDPSASEGMQPLPSRRRRTRVPPAKIGSVSQATRNFQARRDARP